MKLTPPKPIPLPRCEHGHAHDGYVIVVTEGERESGLTFSGDSYGASANWWVPEHQAAMFNLAEIAAERRGIDPERADYELMPACCWRAGA